MRLLLSKRSMIFSLLSTTSFIGMLSGCSTPDMRKVELTNRPKPSLAKSFKEYRLDAAKHLYGLNPRNIFTGKLPPLLYAVGVVRIEISAAGDLKDIDWMRKPTHAPEVVAEIEKRIRQASPFPAAKNIGEVSYTETWLWHKSGRFQLDTLSEGQT
jgi:periplasmic protein TonB